MNKMQNLQQIILFGCTFLIFFNKTTNAQIIPDNTLGAEASRLTPNVLINNINADRIDGGAVRGSNLFHSFSQFNISDGQRIYFGNPSGVENVLSRVTGSSASNIFGILGVDGNANLFLINPNGILFGENARLDVRGSFVGSTANAVQFGEQGFFDATNPEAPPLLTIQPSALFFRRINANSQGITNRTRPNANDAALASSFAPQQGSRYWVGGNITFDGGQWGVVNNRAELGGLAEVGSVGLIGNGNQMQLAFPEGVLRADVVFKKNAFLLTTAGGSITVNANNISLSERSFITSILQAGEGQPGVAAGDIVVNATGNVTLDNLSNIVSLGLENSLGDTGNIAINAQSIRLTNQSQIGSNGLRNQGNIILNAKDNITLDTNSIINTTGNLNSIGKSGDITIASGNMNLSNQSGISSANMGQGQSGKITLKVQEGISLTSGSHITSSSSASVVGGVNNLPSGNIEINTKTLTLDDSNTSITSSNIDEGRGGDIRIVADDSILLNGFGSISSSSTGKGDSGNIELQTPSLTLINGGSIGTQSSGLGNSGNLLVNGSDSVSLSGIITSTNPQTGEAIAVGSGLTTSAFGTGNGGQLTINTQRLSINDGGYITTTSGEFGRGGNLTINAKDFMEVVGRSPNLASRVSTSTLGSGDSGSLNINTSRLSIRDGAEVITLTPGTGKGGDLTIDAKNSVEVIGGSSSSPNNRSIISTTAFVGDTGNMKINTGSFSIRDGGQVTTSTLGQGQGGNLIVNADRVELIGASADGRFFSSLISAAIPGSTGDAGDLTITTKDLFLQGGVQVNAGTSGRGKGGNLTINAQDLFARDGARVFTGTFGAGQAGDLRVNASNKVELLGTFVNGSPSGLIASAERGSSGDGGNLNITTQNLLVQDGAQVLASTFSSGKGGDLTVNASESVQLIGQSANSDFLSGLFASSEKDATGNAGNLTVNTQRLLARDGAQVIAATFGAGKAGNVTVKASESIQLIGKSANNQFASGLFASAERDSTGDAGDLKVDTQNLFVGDRAGIFVNSLGTGNAGIMTINSDRIRLDNQASLNANTRSPNKDPKREQATINLNTGALMLSRNSKIITDATGENVIGGNININADVLAALQNSDISANSSNFRGGRVRITSQGIFGTQPRNFLTTESDITTKGASPTLSGSTEINQPNIDPSQGLVVLPQIIIDPDALIAQNPCLQGAGSQFIVTGKGGLPPSPNQVLGDEAMQADLIEPDPMTLTQGKPQTDEGKNPSNEKPISRNKIIPAQGWIINERGEVILTAYAANGMETQREAHSSNGCSVR
ncbi:filamentous hemagglutinin N-terminal domain-containing protein [Nostoc sp. CHAB 5836]|uniref:two-partner secretion domain-containing protein n=1 Tax=Nostoc sp. CHAB 5836 TaxID=2780404 RepID=UPI001E6035F1|nr:filamentous hemagglutinin N-terminal domain-containing protein [Nostoc sp. CHAB 5836]MCC5613754.1 filamentous hemagglutinin N-terminal domain-containing protein [Nostoc sp. CHAB 5836]